MTRTYTREDAARDRFLRESTGIGSAAPWAMTPGRYTSDDLDRLAAAADRERYREAPETEDAYMARLDALADILADDDDWPERVDDDGTDDDGRWGYDGGKDGAR